MSTKKPTKRPTNGLHKRNEDPVGSQGKLIALLFREAAVKKGELARAEARAKADEILKQLADPNVDAATKQQIKDRFSKIHLEWIKDYEGTDSNPAPQGRGRRGATVGGLLEQFQQSFTITGDEEDFVSNDVIEEWICSTNQTKNLRKVKEELKTHCQNQNPPIVIDSGANLGRVLGTKGIKKIEVVVEPATIPSKTEHITEEEANLTSKIRELNGIAERLLETGAVTVKGTRHHVQRSEAEAVFQFVIPAAQSQLNNCIRFLKKGDDLPTADEVKSYYEGKIDALDYLQDAQRDQMKRCVRAASPDLAPTTIVKRCAELNLELCEGCQNIAAIIERRPSKMASQFELAKPENLCVKKQETQEALESSIVLLRVHEAIADELKTYEKSVLQGMKGRGESLEDRLRPRARFFLEYQSQVHSEAGARADPMPGARARIKAMRKNNWTGRKHTAQGNNDPHTRRVRVLTDRMRSTVHIRDL